MTSAGAQNLPEYDNPPVVEVACGVLFEPIEKLNSPYLGLLWQAYQDEYPECQDAPPLMPAIERYEGDPERIGLALAEAAFASRTWFIHQDQRALIQVQRDRFLHNWRKVSEEDTYPRYHSVIEMFKRIFGTFEAFLAEYSLGTLKPLQFEMTYVNHIPQGEGWNTLSEIGDVFPDFNRDRSESRFLQSYDSINWTSSFLLPERQGRLHASIRSAKQKEDSRPVLVFDLTARGVCEQTTQEGMYAWFDLAREWIVLGFKDLTSENVQKSIWRRRI